jgi:HlyD family secretion protein
MKKRTWIILGALAIVAVVVGAYFYVRGRNQAATATQLQTVVAARGDLTAMIGATGTVRSNQNAILTWQTSGSVETVEIKIGDRINAGDVLATLLETSLPQSVILAQADLVNAQQALNNLFDSKAQQAQAQLNLANAQKDYDAAVMSRNNVRTHANNSLIENYRSSYVLAQDKLDNAKEYYDEFANAAEDDLRKAQAYNSLYAAQQERDKAYNNWVWYEYPPSPQDIAVAEGKVAVATATLDDAQREWDRLKDGPDPADIEAAQAKVTAIQATINMAKLVAPFAGMVSEVDVMVGDQVRSGSNAFRIDDLSHLLADVQVSEVDINSVKVGQPVTITFDAILGQEYHGKVTQVAQVGDVVQGAVNFTVTVEITDSDEQVKPGMTAAVNIVVNALKDVLLVPNRAVRLVDGQRVVYVLRNGLPVEVKITLGASSDTVSEVVSGDLKEGDLIILNPSTTLIPGGGMGGSFVGGG